MKKSNDGSDVFDREAMFRAFDLDIDEKTLRTSTLPPWQEVGSGYHIWRCHGVSVGVRIDDNAN